MINIRLKTAEALKADLDLPEEVTETLFDMGVISERGARDLLIRNEYKNRINFRRKTDVKIFLADRYCVSFSAVDKIVAGISDKI